MTAQNKSEAILEELELLEVAGNSFSVKRFLECSVTPVFFGSALTNFGVEPFFDAFASLAPPPGKRNAFDSDDNKLVIEPLKDPFSAYVFKIQANMDPNHRDSMAYLRICSGVFERDMEVIHPRGKKPIRLSRSHTMFAGARETLDKGFPGDIIGVVNPGVFSIGDTVSTEGGFSFEPMPKFPPEVVARIRPREALKRKNFTKGMEQFISEGAVLVLKSPDDSGSYLIAAVGPLQFEVIQHRLKSEYGIESELDLLPYTKGAWIEGDSESLSIPSATLLADDMEGNHIFLYARSWQKDYVLENNPEHSLVDFR